QVINHKRRPDARAFDEVREIWIEAGVLPRTHGSAIFTRGETQALVTTTLGTSDDMQRLEGFEGEAKKRFMLHYNFPPFSVGVVKEGEQYAIITDIAGAEDHYGDMDFKVAGTKDGITALQMDIKVAGITSQIMREALAQAQRGRLHILGKMEEVISSGREKISDYAPRFYTVQIPVDKIRDLIEPGGKMIRSIVEKSGVKIDVE